MLRRRFVVLAIAGLIVGGGLGITSAFAHSSDGDATVLGGGRAPERIGLLDCTGAVVGYRTWVANEAVDVPPWRPPKPPGSNCPDLTVQLSTEPPAASPAP
jgi:hypothetical protein